jgi:hypothetical protein
MTGAMRKNLWAWIRRGIPEGRILPLWALVIRAALFPLEFFYWKMSKTLGYQIETDIWLIEGMQFSATSLHRLARAQGQAYRFTRTGETITVECGPDGFAVVTADGAFTGIWRDRESAEKILNRSPSAKSERIRPMVFADTE